MHPWTLCVYAIVPLVMLGTTEYLLQTSLWHIHLFNNHGQKRLVFREILAQFFGLFVVLLVELFFYDLDQAVKKMEPFYQLSKPDGANGWDSLCVDYFRTLIYITPILAFRHSHWAVLCSSITAIISTNALSTLALRIFTTDSDEETVMDKTSTRLFETCLGLLSLITGILAVLILRRRSGVEEFPDGFDSLIDFTSCRHLKGSLYSLFKERTRDDMSEEELNAVIGPLQFRLQRRVLRDHSFDIVIYDYTEPASQVWYRMAWGGCRKRWAISRKKDKHDSQSRFWGLWSICKAGLATAWECFKLPFGWILRLGATASQLLCDLCSFWGKRLQHFRGRWLWQHSHPTLLQTVPISVVTTLLLVLFFIANGQPFWATSSGFFRFIGEERMARSAVSTVVNTLIWAQINKHAKFMEPMYLLLRRQGAPYGAVNRDYLGMWPFYDIYHSIVSLKKTRSKKASDYVMVMVILGTHASNLFGLFWNMLNLNDGSSGFYTILSMMIGCECIMIAALGVIITYRRRPVLPRQPVTLASIISLIYRTNIVPPEGPADTHALSPSVSPNQKEKSAIPAGEQEKIIPPSGVDIEVEGSRRDSFSDVSTLHSPGLGDITDIHTPLRSLIEPEAVSNFQPSGNISNSRRDSHSDITPLNPSEMHGITGPYTPSTSLPKIFGPEIFSNNPQSSDSIPNSRRDWSSNIISLNSPGVDGIARFQRPLSQPSRISRPNAPRNSESISGSSQYSVTSGGPGAGQYSLSCSTSHTLFDIKPSDELSAATLFSVGAQGEEINSYNEDLVKSQPSQEPCSCLEVSAEAIRARENITCVFGWLECEDGERHLGIWRWDSGVRPYTFGVGYSSPA